MKRHESIVTLSREHHFGLLFCWKIKQGIHKQVPAKRIQSYIKYFWETHTQRHFEKEETLLFTLLQHNMVEQAIAEHKQISHLINRVLTTNQADSKQFSILAEVLDDHIRFEERILFPYIESTLPSEILTSIGRQLDQLHQTQEKDDYSDEFWV